MEEKKPYISHSADDIQVKLDKKLGPEYISKRVGYGSSRIAYIEGWRVINLANQIFGYNGWSTEVKSVTIDFLDERQGKFCIGCTAIVRVTLTGGSYREDIGYGTVENERRKSAAFERAKKSAVTDAMKRSLRGFGNALGNCLYDKDFLSRIDKVKFDPPDFDEGNLFRPSDEITESSRSNTIENTSSKQVNTNKRRQTAKVGTTVKTIPNGKDEIHRDTIAKIKSIGQHENNQPSNLTSGGKQTASEQDELLDDSLMFSDDFQDEDIINMERRDYQLEPVIEPVPNATSSSPIESVTFVTAKAAPSLQNKGYIPQENMFDPKYQAQSIKHTLDQSTSKHVPAAILKEKGIENTRDSFYEKFAPKGKQIGANVEPNDNLSSHNPTGAKDGSPIGSPPLTTAPTISKFAPQTTVVHPNNASNITTPAKTTRREVGRPKINPIYHKKAES